MKIALIGAGAAGAACVSVLRSRGADFSVFEKARGAGGRLATRRVTLEPGAIELRYDHGAPFFKLTSIDQNPICLGLQKRNIIESTEQGFTSCPDMPRLVKDLFGTTAIQFGVEVQSLERQDGSWFVQTKIKSDIEKTETFGPFDKVIVSAPAPQALKILNTNKCSWLSDLNAIQYVPCWALMFSTKTDTFQNHPASGSIISSLVLQNTKPGRIVPKGIASWVAQASAEWSLKHLESESSMVQNAMLEEALRLSSSSHLQVVHATVHRWRYSQVSAALNTPALIDDACGLYYVGDACHGGGVEGALLSGAHVGNHIAASLN